MHGGACRRASIHACQPDGQSIAALCGRLSGEAAGQACAAPLAHACMHVWLHACKVVEARAGRDALLAGDAGRALRHLTRAAAILHLLRPTTCEDAATIRTALVGP